MTYQFPQEVRKAYEAQPFPLVYEQYMDGKAVPLLISDGFCTSLGIKREEALECYEEKRFERIHPDDAERVKSVIDAFGEHHGEYDVLFRIIHADGTHVIHALARRQIMADGSELSVITFTDLTESAEQESVLKANHLLARKDLFYRDPVTKLPNLNYLRQFSKETIQTIRMKNQEPVLLYFDVCAMNSYNDQYGVEGGDQLLRLIGRILSETFPDALITRGSEDHFILIGAFEGEDALDEKILALNQRIRSEASGNTTGIQAGISRIDAEETFKDALDHARRALKQIARNMSETYRYYSGKDSEDFRKERYIIEHFEQAMQEGWIRVYYQSIIRVKTGRIASLEGLARWIDPERGMIPPGEFIPVLEKYHLLSRLDLYMAEQVCREIPLRLEAGFPLIPVSVNFSAQDFEYVNVPEELERIYLRYFPEGEGKMKYLFVEITEQDMVSAQDRFQDQLEELRKRGFRIWLDDFGSAYSSLNAFSRFDVDLIKFDMDLLRHYDDKAGVNRMILRAMTAIAEELGTETLCEGMETEEQKNFLKEIGCDFAQGFLFHKPESLEDFIRRMGGGKNARPCETPEERSAFKKR